MRMTTMTVTITSIPMTAVIMAEKTSPGKNLTTTMMMNKTTLMATPIAVKLRRYKRRQ